MAEVSLPLPRPKSASATSGLAYYLRVLGVIGGIDFKARYTDAALGYLWSLAKPLGYFGVLWLVFAHTLRTANSTRHFALFLLIGVLLFTFFLDVVSVMLPSIVQKGTILRRLAFPPVLVPLSTSISVCLTFCANVSVIVVFMAVQKVAPRWEWFLVAPLLAELYLFAVTLGLLLAALYVRFRDIGQVWELLSQILFFASAIFFPIGIVPGWAQKVAFLNPFVQIMQDIRHSLLGGASGPFDLSATAVYAGYGGRLVPLAIAALIAVCGLVVFRREAPYFAERI
jgi:ABC-2 type transport system permease protein